MTPPGEPPQCDWLRRNRLIRNFLGCFPEKDWDDVSRLLALCGVLALENAAVDVRALTLDELRGWVSHEARSLRFASKRKELRNFMAKLRHDIDDFEYDAVGSTDAAPVPSRVQQKTESESESSRTTSQAAETPRTRRTRHLPHLTKAQRKYSALPAEARRAKKRIVFQRPCASAKKVRVNARRARDFHSSEVFDQLEAKKKKRTRSRSVSGRPRTSPRLAYSLSQKQDNDDVTHSDIATTRYLHVKSHFEQERERQQLERLKHSKKLSLALIDGDEVVAVLDDHEVEIDDSDSDSGDGTKSDATAEKIRQRVRAKKKEIVRSRDQSRANPVLLDDSTKSKRRLSLHRNDRMKPSPKQERKASVPRHLENVKSRIGHLVEADRRLHQQRLERDKLHQLQATKASRSRKKPVCMEIDIGADKTSKRTTRRRENKRHHRPCALHESSRFSHLLSSDVIRHFGGRQMFHESKFSTEFDLGHTVSSSTRQETSRSSGISSGSLGTLGSAGKSEAGVGSSSSDSSLCERAGAWTERDKQLDLSAQHDRTLSSTFNTTLASGNTRSETSLSSSASVTTFDTRHEELDVDTSTSFLVLTESDNDSSDDEENTLHIRTATQSCNAGQSHSVLASESMKTTSTSRTSSSSSSDFSTVQVNVDCPQKTAAHNLLHVSIPVMSLDSKTFSPQPQGGTVPSFPYRDIINNRLAKRLRAIIKTTRPFLDQSY